MEVLSSKKWHGKWYYKRIAVSSFGERLFEDLREEHLKAIDGFLSLRWICFGAMGGGMVGTVVLYSIL